ncbi:MAG: hypothetical protein N3D82_00070 [Ignisphaera sp.]|nr:hypothetical protein [Ignisphaera sp.]MCX8167412.1 hypothetical protein [Ignisphaera sp.]MDW8085932.1 hypothetical protein [Ignisphaera sp.]
MGSRHHDGIIERLDSLSSIIASFGTTLSYIDITSLASRYYISIHDVVLPVAIDDEKILTSTTFFEPIFNIYLHENKAYAILKNTKDLQPMEGSQWSKISVIDLTQSEDFLAIAAASIAEKIYLSPSERSIIKVLPGNLKIYVDTAFSIVKRVEDAYISSSRGQKIPLTKKPLEMILWLRKTAADTVKEVAYLKGVSIRAIRVAFTDYEVEVKMYRSGEASFEILKLLEKIVTTAILSSIHKNIERVTRILFTAVNIIS